ncbi:methyltransferase domain-containing protein [Tundrisphaera sp. TA3]|uniref:methyltransferase domain-containing protein n=1 Tax=Tundrisphaera sp. TA3 TaxID=3435775 RepID=UPI003EBFF6C3
MAEEEDLPDYEPMLAAYHRAYAVELKSMIDGLPIREGDRVLEAACGDGSYTPWLAERVGDGGSVVAFDVLPAFLRVASREAARSDDASRIRFVTASIDRLPFAEGSFDVAWCAQSLFSLPEPVASVRQLAGRVRPGGLVAVLENDTLHQIILPWPVELELALRTAEWKSFREESDHPGKFYVGRRLLKVFRQAGLVDIRIDTHASDRVAPLDESVRTFLGEYLADLVERVGPRLDPGHRRALEKLADPDSPGSLVNDPDTTLTCIDHVVSGRVPAA